MKLRTFFIALASVLVVGTILGVNLWVLSDPGYDGKPPRGAQKFMQTIGRKLRIAVQNP